MKRLQIVSLLLVCLGLFLALFIAYSPLSATGGATFTVNSTADAVDFSPGNGLCETAAGNGICTLRAAVQETNSLPGADTIQLPAGTYTLTLPGIDTTAAAGDLDILDDLTIIGAGADQTIIDGNQLDRVIHIVCADYAYPIIDEAISPIIGKDGQGLCPTDITVSISQLTIRNGLVPTQPGGGGIFNTATLILDNITIRENSITNQDSLSQGGGGIANYGILTMTHSIVISNTASGPGAGIGGGLGLGIVEEQGVASQTYISDSQITGNTDDGINLAHGETTLGAELIIERSLVSENSRRGINHSGNRLFINESEIVNNADAGVFISTVNVSADLVVEITHSLISGNSSRGLHLGQGEISISNSTISNNSTPGFGGGLRIWTLEGVTIINTTIAQNSAASGGGIYVSDNVGAVTITNSIISENNGENCSGVTATFSAGNNIEDNTDCNFTNPSDMQNTDPMLGPLQNNGGSTNTHALLPGSPAADAGNDTVCQSSPVNSLDQRRYSRVDQDGNMDGGTDGDPCDIGAYEISAAPTSVQLTSNLQSATRPGTRLIAIGIFIMGLMLLIGRQLSLSRKIR